VSREHAETLKKLTHLRLVETLVPLTVGLERLDDKLDQPLRFHGESDGFLGVDGHGGS
jgi:hypothetical protein